MKYFNEVLERTDYMLEFEKAVENQKELGNEFYWTFEKDSHANKEIHLFLNHEGFFDVENINGANCSLVGFFYSDSIHTRSIDGSKAVLMFESDKLIDVAKDLLNHLGFDTQETYKLCQNMAFFDEFTSNGTVEIELHFDYDSCTAWFVDKENSSIMYMEVK